MKLSIGGKDFEVKNLKFTPRKGLCDEYLGFFKNTCNSDDVLDAWSLLGNNKVNWTSKSSSDEYRDCFRAFLVNPVFRNIDRKDTWRRSMSPPNAYNVFLAYWYYYNQPIMIVDKSEGVVYVG